RQQHDRKFTGLTPGRHVFQSFHIQVFGDTTNGCKCKMLHHYSLGSSSIYDERQVGDLGNIVANKDFAEVFIRDLQVL
ncbi:hypothetical protein ACJX0J_038710, partial [Zea mays]